MASITIDIDDEEKKILEKRGKKTFLNLKEQIEDIVRRSCITYKNKGSIPADISDDKLLNIFSRSTRGRKRKG